jgi:RimJ/RimL family protein N-acetyltransferase
VKPAVRLEPWGPRDLPLLEKLNAPEMTRDLGGPERPEKLADRQRRYEQMPADRGRVFKVVEDAAGEALGQVAYWDRAWREQEVFEIGWAVLPAFQRRGIARAAVSQALDRARADGRHRFVHAFPSVDNAPSNALCRSLGFQLLGEGDFEYPKGSFIRCNDWRLDLTVKA